jgi:hypothetical protein
MNGNSLKSVHTSHARMPTIVTGVLDGACRPGPSLPAAYTVLVPGGRRYPTGAGCHSPADERT